MYPVCVDVHSSGSAVRLHVEVPVWILTGVCFGGRASRDTGLLWS